LIDHRRVITAAHCVNRQRTNEIILSFGRHDITNYAEDSAVNSKVDTISIHPDYNEDHQDADIAILVTQKFIDFTSLIRPACLWTTNKDLVGQDGVIAGWGSTKNEEVASAVQEAEITIRSKFFCWNIDPAFKLLLTDNKICAGGDTGVPCFGDSGGGLMIKENGRWKLRGVVSATLDDNGRCTRTKLTSYTDVVKFQTWIEESKNLL
jgi:secreted trypsin-like serine protease